MINDDSDNAGSESCSAGMCTFPFHFDESIGRVEDSVGHVDDSVGCVSGMGSGVFSLTGIKSIGDVVPLIVFAPEGVESKGGQLIEIFWHSI